MKNFSKIVFFCLLILIYGCSKNISNDVNELEIKQEFDAPGLLQIEENTSNNQLGLGDD